MNLEETAFLAGCIAFAVMLPGMLDRYRMNRRLKHDAAEFLHANGVTTVAELRAKAEASQKRCEYSGPPSGRRDVSSYEEGRKTVRRPSSARS